MFFEMEGLIIQLGDCKIEISKDGKYRSTGRCEREVRGLSEKVFEFLCEVRIGKKHKSDPQDKMFIFKAGDTTFVVWLDQKASFSGKGFKLGFEGDMCYVVSKNIRLWETIGKEKTKELIEEIVQRHKITVPDRFLKYEVDGERLLILWEGKDVAIEIKPEKSEIFYRYLYGKMIDYKVVAQWVRNIFDNNFESVKIKDLNRYSSNIGDIEDIIMFEVGYMTFVYRYYRSQKDEFSWGYLSPEVFIRYEREENSISGLIIEGENGRIFLQQMLNTKQHNKEFKNQADRMRTLYRYLKF
ncbi:MAG: hypothetical protein ABDI07_11020 [Candidatus Kryptonium sp.]